MICKFHQYDSNNNHEIDTYFKFNGTDLVRIHTNPIPLGLYKYQIACKYNYFEYLSEI